MDGGEQAELDALRRRAYAPNADIQRDPAALARLVELEDLALRSVDESAAATSAPHVPEEALVLDPAPAVDPRVDAGLEPAMPGLRRWLRPGPLIAAAAAAVAVVAAVALAQPHGTPAPAGETTHASVPQAGAENGPADPGTPGAEVLTTVRPDAAYSDYLDWPVDASGTVFPSSTTLDWAAPLGDHYGWLLWVAGGGVYPHTEHCILLERGSVVRARCLMHGDQDAGRLHVELTAAEIAPEERPPQMEPSESIRFWWREDVRIDVMLGYFGSD